MKDDSVGSPPLRTRPLQDASRPKLTPPLALVATASLERSRRATDELERMGFRILQVRSVIEGGEALAADRGPVDLVALDAEASEPAVHRLVATLKGLVPALSVVYISNEPEPISRGLTFGSGLGSPLFQDR